jgi:AcrR family transcriptional regulator
MSEWPTTTRDRILRAAADLLAEGGRDAVSTRAVAAAARVQAPAIYRLFGDKRGLLDAVAAHGFAAYLRDKTARPPSGDPVDDLRRGWDLHVAFGVANPAVYTLMYGDPRPGAAPEAAREAAAVLDGLVRRVAEAGRLRVAADRAAAMIHAAGCGVTLSLIATPPAERDPGLSSAAREAVLAAVATGGPDADGDGGVAARAAALRAALPGTPGLSGNERALLGEWLDRVTRASAEG